MWQKKTAALAHRHRRTYLGDAIVRAFVMLKPKAPRLSLSVSSQ